MQFCVGSGTGLTTGHADAGIAMIMGVAQTGAGLILYTMGTRSVSAVQLAMLPLIKVVLSPIWVAMFIGEIPGTLTLLGGALIVCAIAGDALFNAGKQVNTTQVRQTLK